MEASTEARLPWFAADGHQPTRRQRSYFAEAATRLQELQSDSRAGHEIGEGWPPLASSPTVVVGTLPTTMASEGGVS